MTTVFTHTTVVTVDPGQTVLHDVALAVDGDTIVAIGPTEAVLQSYPQADTYDGRGKALFPGLINCHAHLTATLNRGITEDFGFPPALHLPVPAHSMLSEEEITVMALLGALESIKSGSTTVVENSPGIGVYAAELAKTGLRWVLAESGRDAVVPPGWRPGEDVYEFSPALREEMLQRIHDLFASWHGAHNGLITVFPATALAEASSPELLHAVREFAEQHDVKLYVSDEGDVEALVGQAVERFGPIVSPGDQFGDHGVVVDADLVAFADAAVDADMRLLFRGA